MNANPRLLPIFLAAGLFAAACSTAVPDSPFSLVGPDGKHPSGWPAGHGLLSGGSGEPCIPCHGEGLAGGISRVSCFTVSLDSQPCHLFGPGFHPSNWLDKGLRGSTGYHATAYQSGFPISGHACSDCHTPPPLDAVGGACRRCHFDISGRRTPLAGASYSHGALTGHALFVSPAREVCVACHEIDNRFGYPPFCHNCHEPFPSAHPAGWASPSQHGAAAKRAPSASGGFPWCQTCHGDDFRGGFSGRTCLSTTTCHAVTPGRPHSGLGFRGSHPGTDAGNAIACAGCHRSANGSAGCFNQTLCHGAQTD